MSVNEIYSGNPQLKKAHINLEFTGEQVQEWIKCAKDPVYFARKYIKIISVDKGVVPFDMYKFQEKLIKTFHKNRFNICKLPRQPLCLKTPLPTTNGWKPSGDIQVGDYVYSPEGHPVEVIKKSPTFYNTKCYKFHFDSNEEIIADEKHLWEIVVNGTPKLLETHQVYTLYKNRQKISIRSAVIPEGFEITNENSPSTKQHSIVKIEEVETTPVACITVDSASHLFVCGNNFIPSHNSGKSTTAVSYLLHYAIFNDNVNIAILANKAQTAKDLLARLQLAYENLPKWLQQGVKIWNKASLELDNGSKIIAASTSASSVRGGTYNIIFLDEFAFIPNQIAEEFFRSTYPTITSGQNTKVIIISTPNGMNLYYKLWLEAERKLNGYIPTEVAWNEVPGRDSKFKEQTISNIGIDAWNQEFECSFLGSAGTLISPAKLKTLVYDPPISSNESLDIYKKPEKNRLYLLIADCSEGVGKDYHAFIVFDITTIPYTIAAKYKNNELKTMVLADVIKNTAAAYNNAYILIEIASIGDQVAKNIHYDLEYGNLLMSSVNGRAGQVIGQGFYGPNAQYGVKISKQVKRIGCSNLKTIIEDDKVLIRDFEIISELTTYISKKNSYEAEVGCNDDLVSCLVMFAWLIVQDYFKDLTNNDIRKKITEEQKEQLDMELAPLGFFSDGMHNDDDVIIDKKTGDVWLVADKAENSYFQTLDLEPFAGSYNYFP
jgi:intein/homing endonuclease